MIAALRFEEKMCNSCNNDQFKTSMKVRWSKKQNPNRAGNKCTQKVTNPNYCISWALALWAPYRSTPTCIFKLKRISELVEFAHLLKLIAQVASTEVASAEYLTQLTQRTERCRFNLCADKAHQKPNATPCVVAGRLARLPPPCSRLTS